MSIQAQGARRRERGLTGQHGALLELLKLPQLLDACPDGRCGASPPVPGYL